MALRSLPMPLRRSFSLVLVGFFLVVTGSRADTPAASDPAGFITTMVNSALDTLKDRQLTPQVRDQRFTALFHGDFDIPRLSRFVLGRYWSAASDGEREQFNKLFERWVVRTYSARFSQYDGGPVTVTVGTARALDGSDWIVPSQIVRPGDGSPISVDWRLHHDSTAFHVVDVDVEGASMALTQKQEFASVIERNGGTVAALNKALDEKLASSDSGSATR